jgi:hypothetical protein
VGNLSSLIDPFAAAYQAYSGLSGGPLLSGYDFKTNPTAGVISGGDDTSTEEPVTPTNPTWGNGYSGATDRDNHDASEPTERGPFGWEKDYWGGDFAPNYGIMDNLKTFAYGRSLPGSFKIGNLLMGLVNPFSPTLSLMNPLNSPGVVTGMKQFASNYNLDYNQLRQAVQTAYGGTTTGKRGGLLSGLLSMFKAPSTTNMNAIVNATDTLRGVLGLTTPGWQEVFNNPNFSVMDEIKHYDPYAQGFLSTGIVDPYMATQFMDAYGASGQTPSAVNANFAFDDDVYGTGVLGLMVDPTIAATSKIGFLQGIKEGKNMGVGLDPNATASTGARSAATGLQTALDKWAKDEISTSEMAGIFGDYTDTKGLTNKQLSEIGKNFGLTDREIADKYQDAGFGKGSGLGDSTKGDPGLGGNGIDKDNTSGTGCFVLGTPVRLPKGVDVPIETVNVGDKVLSYNTALGTFVEAEVEELRRPKSKNLVRISFIDGTGITTTADHPFYTGEMWVAVNPGAASRHVGGDVSPMRSGTQILSTSGRRTVREIAPYEMPEEVPLYNLKIGGTHTYIADGLVVHNK